MKLFNAIFSATLALGLVASSGGSFAQTNNPAWLEDLERQLAKDEACKVEYFVNMREGQLGGQYFYEARAQCRDGRQFDAVRTDPERNFVIKPCGVVVC